MATRQMAMGGLMLRALLENRFNLKLHRDTRESPIYALTVASSGQKLARTKEGSCIPLVTPEPSAAPTRTGRSSPQPYAARKEWGEMGLPRSLMLWE